MCALCTSQSQSCGTHARRQVQGPGRVWGLTHDDAPYRPRTASKATRRQVAPLNSASIMACIQVPAPAVHHVLAAACRSSAMQGPPGCPRGKRHGRQPTQ